jgi:hypothetical protein
VSAPCKPERDRLLVSEIHSEMPGRRAVGLGGRAVRGLRFAADKATVVREAGQDRPGAARPRGNCPLPGRLGPTKFRDGRRVRLSRGGRPLRPAVVKRLRRQADACSSKRANYLVMQGVTRYKYAVLAGELAQLARGVAEGSHLHLGEAADLSHGDFSRSHASGGHLPTIPDQLACFYRSCVRFWQDGS